MHHKNTKKLILSRLSFFFLLKNLFKKGIYAFVLLGSFFQFNAYANTLSTQEITLDFENTPLKTILSKIESTTTYTFVYKSQEIALDKKVSIKVENQSLSKTLGQLFSGLKISYTVIGNQIILKASENKSKDHPVENVSIQEQVISGTIVDESGLPLPGATLMVKGTNEGTTTDFDGNFSLDVSVNTVLIISYVGYATQEIRIENTDFLSITLSPEADALEEIVVIGYGALSKAKVLGAVASVTSEDLQQLPVGGMEAAISGRAAGVQVVNSGAPGSSSQVKIRGVGSLTAGTDPLIVVDGYPMTEGSDLNAINPLDIESIDVLKDAASTAIYGSRGANGVIMVTTKKAKTNQTTINFDTYIGFQKVLNQPEFLNAYQFTQMVKEARDWGYVSEDPSTRSEDDDNATRFNNSEEARHLIPANFARYLENDQGLTDYNWLDAIFQNGSLENHNLSISGRNQKTNWYLSGSYFKQEGLIIGSGFERYTANLKINTQLTDKIKFGINLTPSTSDIRDVIEGWTDSPLQQAILSEPYFTAFNNQGDLNISQQIRWHNNGGTNGALAENPVAIALQRKDTRSKFRLFGNAYTSFELADGLILKTLFGGDFDYSLREQFRPSTIGSYRNEVGTVNAWAKEQTKARKNIITETTLTYNKKIDNHQFNLLAGYSYQKENYSSIYVDAPELSSNEVKNVAGTEITTTSKDLSEWVLISYFGRLQYDYYSKYLLSGSIRKDGSSRFGKNKKFGTFPSFSLGWIVSKEDFFPKDFFVSNLKVRYSWGKSGNNQIGNYASIPTLKALNAYLDDEFATGYIPSTAPNEDITWETSITNNIGADIALFQSSLRIGMDYFTSKTKDMLLEVPVPLQSGFPTSLQNIGAMENKGFEFTLSSDLNLGNVTWNFSANYSKINNKVTALGNGQEQIIAGYDGGTNITKVGGTIGAFYGYEVSGIYKSQDEIDNSAQKYTDVKVGDWAIVDQLTVDSDNDGVLDSGDGVINEDDRTIIGSPLPDFNYGFNNRFTYKNFDLNIFIEGVSGVDVLSRTVRNATNGQGFSNQLVSYYNNRYHPTNNPDGNLARPDYTQSQERLRAEISSAFIENGSFLKVKNISLGFNFPEKLTSKMGLRELRVYLTAKNPLMLTDFKGFNPEQSSSNPLAPSDTQGSYPLNKSYVIGANFTF